MAVGGLDLDWVVRLEVSRSGLEAGNSRLLAAHGTEMRSGGK